MWGAQKRSKTRLKNTPCKNAFKKHPLQNRTNVQIKGGGGQRPFEQCSKKLHFFERMASLIHIITSLSLSICGVCESHKFPIICPLWVLNELTSIVDKMQHDWKRTPYIHSFKIGARITFQSKSHVIIFWWLLCVSIFNPSLFQGKRWGHRELME